MTQEEKQLLLKDLCCRLPYGVFCDIYNEKCTITEKLLIGGLSHFCNDTIAVRPYLRPMSSMTEEEKNELLQISNFNPEVDDIYYDSICCIERTSIDIVDIANFISWLNKNMFDYRGLIEKGLAIAVTEENNPYEA